MIGDQVTDKNTREEELWASRGHLLDQFFSMHGF